MFKSLRKLIDRTETLTCDVKPEVSYSNIVTVTQLLRNHSMPLESIFSQCPAGHIKSTPRTFPGVYFKVKDNIGTCTHMLFRSSKMNTVGASCVEHARYSVQCIRQYIEHITGVFKTPEDSVICTSLEGRLTLVRFNVVLMVANASLGVLPNLRHVMDVAPDLAKWNPELFPGLKFLVWISPRNQCKCPDSSKKKNSRNCRCNVNVSIFDTGKMIITGGRNISVVNKALELLKIIFSDTDYQNKSELSEKHLRFEARRKLLLDQEYIEFSGFAKKRGRKEQTQSVFTLIPTKKKRRKKKSKDLPIFLHACDTGQFENVEFMLSINPEYTKTSVDHNGMNAIERLKQIPINKQTNKHYKIISLLEKCWYLNG